MVLQLNTRPRLQARTGGLLLEPLVHGNVRSGLEGGVLEEAPHGVVSVVSPIQPHLAAARRDPGGLQHWARPERHLIISIFMPACETAARSDSPVLNCTEEKASGVTFLTIFFKKEKYGFSNIKVKYYSIIVV